MFRLFLAALIAAVSCQTASAQSIDMRERVSAARSLPLLSVTFKYELQGLLEQHFDEPIVVTRVYAGPRTDSRELGVIIARPATAPFMSTAAELVCRLQGEPERPVWLAITESWQWEYGVLALAMDVRERKFSEHTETAWVQLPPAACGLPIWWPAATADLRGESYAAPGDLYRVPAGVRGVIAYTGTPVELDPEVAYRILRIHDGVIELRREIDLDLDPERGVWPPDRDDDFVKEQEARKRQPVPATIRIKIDDVIDADGRLRLTVAYADPC